MNLIGIHNFYFQHCIKKKKWKKSFWNMFFVPKISLSLLFYQNQPFTGFNESPVTHPVKTVFILHLFCKMELRSFFWTKQSDPAADSNFESHFNVLVLWVALSWMVSLCLLQTDLICYIHSFTFWSVFAQFEGCSFTYCRLPLLFFY